MDEAVGAMVSGKAPCHAVPMLPYPLHEIGGYADIERAVAVAGEGIGAGLKVSRMGGKVRAMDAETELQRDEGFKG